MPGVGTEKCPYFVSCGQQTPGAMESQLSEEELIALKANLSIELENNYSPIPFEEATEADLQRSETVYEQMKGLIGFFPKSLLRDALIDCGFRNKLIGDHFYWLMKAN